MASPRAAFLVGCAAGAGAGLVTTPFGPRPAECVMEVPSGAVVEDIGAGRVRVAHARFGERVHAVPAACHDAAHQPARRDRAPPHPPPWGSKCDLDPSGRNCSCSEPPCTCAHLPCGNWMDNAGLWTHPQLLGGFSSVYTVPESPPERENGQCLFYFIGTENSDGLPRHGQPGPGRTILQPVLTFDPSGWCQESKTGWCMSSWNCCPANITTHSPYLQDVKPGERYLGMFNMTSPGVYEVVSRNLRSGENVTLQMQAQGRLFNWADVTLEVYQIDNCDLFAPGAMVFGNLTLWDREMQPIATDDWLLTGDKPCGGRVARVGRDAITIQHDPDAPTPPSPAPTPYPPCPPPCDCRGCAPNGCPAACRDAGYAGGTCKSPGSTDPTDCCACTN